MYPLKLRDKSLYQDSYINFWMIVCTDSEEKDLYREKEYCDQNPTQHTPQ